MSMFKLFAPRQPELNGEPTREELLRYHAFDGDILAEGYVSPIVLPKMRILELKGSNTFREMAAKCKVSAFELETLCNHDYLQPTMSQLLSLSWAYEVSVMWLLGYHTHKERHLGSRDNTFLALISRRNAAESAAKRIKRKGVLADFFVALAARRVLKLNLAVSSCAARTTALEHIPLSNAELMLLVGQPVYVVLRGQVEGEWGLCEGLTIYTLKGLKDISMNGEDFLVFLTPDVASTADD